MLDLLNLLAEGPRRALRALGAEVMGRLEEVRLRAGQALMVGWDGGEAVVGEGGWLAAAPLNGRLAPSTPDTGGFRACLVTSEDVSRTLQLITRSSVYALEEELRLGYLTLPRGHRVGLTGQAVVEQGRVRRLRHVGGLCIRIAREVLGAADPILPFLVGAGGRQHALGAVEAAAAAAGTAAASAPAGADALAGTTPAVALPPGWASCTISSALIASPPLAGKTTILRDIARQLSEGVPRLGFPGVKVGVVDERSELAACYEGVPQLRVGPRTDVLDGCPKAEGMMMLIRAMSPRVIVTDEFGRPADVEAAREAINSGVALITSAHAADLKELLRRPSLKDLLGEGAFRWIIILGESRGRGTVEAVYDGRTLEPVLAAPLAPGPAAQEVEAGAGSPAGGVPGDGLASATATPPHTARPSKAAEEEVQGGVAQASGRRPGPGGLHLVRPDGGV